MAFGKYDRYVRIEQKTITNDPDYGSEIATWTTYKHAWAQVLDLTSRQQESTKSDLRLLKRPCEVEMRYDAGINATMRIVMVDRDNRILQIVNKPAEIGRRQAIKFMCQDYE